MKNNKVLVVVAIILLIVVLVFLSRGKKSGLVYNPQQPSPQTPNPSSAPEPCDTDAEGSLKSQYNNFKCQYSLKYGTYSMAIDAFKNATDSHMEVTRIDFYVPGKFPREDGDPYFIGRGTVNSSSNDCIVGYMNLVTGVTESHHDVCVIYN